MKSAGKDEARNHESSVKRDWRDCERPLRVSAVIGLEIGWVYKTNPLESTIADMQEIEKGRATSKENAAITVLIF